MSETSGIATLSHAAAEALLQWLNGHTQNGNDAARQLARAHIVTLTTGQWGTVTGTMDDLRAQVAQLQSREQT